MARYKHIDTSPRFLAVDLQRQLLPGSFEYALNHLLDQELDLNEFDTLPITGYEFSENQSSLTPLIRIRKWLNVTSRLPCMLNLIQPPLD